MSQLKRQKGCQLGGRGQGREVQKTEIHKTEKVSVFKDI